MKPSDFEQSLDYESFLSDGVILQIGIGDTNLKLIFYQKLTVDKERKTKRLLLEISLPQETLARLSNASLGRIKAKQNALRIKGNKNDKNTERAYYEYDEAIGSWYDTDEIKLSKEDYYKIHEALVNLRVRTTPS